MARLEGRFNACAHRVKFWYEWDGRRIPKAEREGLETILEEEAEARAREMIAQDYREGDLNATEHEIRGWWTI